ncbi:hypothetical protein OG594_08835 [Streptomyces sp. NBC_01214]|uniref:hypothetical protein n=1 Tax=Streptomyces sp. NBC_01214 TaxID=2903777 RepID=UPI0022568D18|nr:hypothetical protein [Streptomyces sp. NBC_01214]MCX4801755.1 hypothetical protein [Streptomyces sp. NBC_01214]
MNATSLALKPAQPALRLLPGQRPTLDYVLDAPLAEMTAELHVEVITSEITDAEFFGCVVVRGSRIVVMLNPNLGEFEADFFTRYLTAQAYKLEMSPLPTPFDVEVSPMLEGASA